MVRSLARGAVLVVTLTIISGGCNKDENCQPTPVGPSCVNGKVDVNNPMPGPGGSVRASATYAVYEGDCPNNPDSCVRQLSPTNDPDLRVFSRTDTFIVANYTQMYTLRLCMTHPGVPGRTIAGKVLAGTSVKTFFFDEAEPSRPSPVCDAVSFNMAMPGGYSNIHGGEVSMYESDQDLLSDTTTDIKFMLGFRIAGTR